MLSFFRQSKVSLVLFLAVVLAACADGGTAPELGSEASAEVRLGAEIYASNCASCHGSGGGGGLGPNLSDGKTMKNYPDSDSAVQLILIGSRAMPAFGERLSPDEVDAVVLYMREVLNP